MKLSFLETLTEAKQLDISILSAGKFLTSEKKIIEFLNSTVKVEQKTDGVKLTVIKISDNGNLSDYIFSYKGNILFPGEFNYNPDVRIKEESIGSSQFKLVFDHFSKLPKNSIPVDTELAIEFLMKKPTLSSNYTSNHHMVLIGYDTKIKYSIRYGKLKTASRDMLTVKREKFAKELKIDVPVVLFQGILGSEGQFKAGIENKVVKKEFQSRKSSMNWNNPELLLDDVRDLFLDIESKYGGKEEGVVIKYEGKILKFQQSYQLDQTARAKIKQQFKGTKEEEDAYFKRVQGVAREILEGVPAAGSIESQLKVLANDIKRFRVKGNIEHPKKTEAQIKDDIQLSAKQLLLKRLSGNNGALVLGKFRVLSKSGHVKMIKQALKLYDEVLVCIITNKDTMDTLDLRTKMISAEFGSNPKVHIIHAKTGNIVSILNKSPININAVFAGSDRIAGYAKQLERTLGVTTKEVIRPKDAISATEIIEKIEDEKFFKKSTPNKIHGMYKEILAAYV